MCRLARATKGGSEVLLDDDDIDELDELEEMDVLLLELVVLELVVLLEVVELLVVLLDVVELEVVELEVVELDEVLELDEIEVLELDEEIEVDEELELLPKNSSPKYALEIKDSSSVYWQADSSGDEDYVISVTGSWGYAATAPEDIKTACLMIAAGLYKRRLGENLSAVSTITAGGILVTPQDIPSAAREILNHYKRLV